MSASDSEDGREGDSMGKTKTRTAKSAEDDSDDEEGDTMKEATNLTKEEQELMKEIEYDKDADIEDFLKNSEHTNTRKQPENAINKYNKVMSYVYKREGKDFVCGPWSVLANICPREIPRSSCAALVRTSRQI